LELFYLLLIIYFVEYVSNIWGTFQSAGGTGLGVYISRQMAQAMGGKLYAESPGKGKGSTFILELPLVKK